MTECTRRHLLGTLLAAPAALGQFITKPADQIVVDHAALVDMAFTALTKEKHLAVKDISETPAGNEMFRIIRIFNDNLRSRGYDGEHVTIGAIFLTPNRMGGSFRIGNQGIIYTGEENNNLGPAAMQRQLGHEFGHLYYRHGTNFLAVDHPAMYKGNNLDIHRLQHNYVRLFNQVDLNYEKAFDQKDQEIDPRMKEKLAEEMAVKQICLPELSLEMARDAIKNLSLAMEPNRRNFLREGYEGMIEAAHTPLPGACGPVRQGMRLPITPSLK